ncbi:MAG: flagellar export chaperone FliS [Steroidobacteraceae bacterium]
MQSHRGAARYATMRNQGLVTDASPTRLVQIMYEQIVSELATAQGCMKRIKDNLPLPDVITKGKAMGKAVRLINQLNATLDMERGGEVAANLRSLYVYMLARLLLANASNDASIVGEISELVRKVKSGWDQIVTDQR